MPVIVNVRIPPDDKAKLTNRHGHALIWLPPAWGTSALLLLVPVLAGVLPVAVMPFYAGIGILAFTAVAVHLAIAHARLRGQVESGEQPRLEIDEAAISMMVEGKTTRFSWEDIEWVSVRTGVPPRRHRQTLVVGLLPEAPRPPRGRRHWPPWYELQPRWYADVDDDGDIVRVVDVALLDIPWLLELFDTLERLAGDKWREPADFPGKGQP